jgi:Zn-dependent protease
MFTQKEVRDLLISVLVLALAFSRFDFSILLTTLFIVVIAFFAHEMSHKFVAMHYGYDAEYKMWPLGLLLGIVTALIPGGITFAAPGAVMISPYKKGFAFKVVNVTKRSYAIISLAGPLVNIVLASSLLLVSAAYPLDLFSVTARISFFLAFFNLLPVPPMDGSKIMGWNVYLWGMLLAVSFAGAFFV